MKKYTVEGGTLYRGNCLDIMQSMKKGSVDLVFGSPPYENARTYGKELEFDLKGQDWVDWMVEVFKASLRVSKGLVAFVVGHGKNGVHDWSAAPALLMADLKRTGITLRNPIIYQRDGIPGSGGRDWFRACYEWIICATNKPEQLQWSDTKAVGHKPKCGIGGTPTHRMKDGKRVHKVRTTSGYKDGDAVYKEVYRVQTDIANPGNIIDCGSVGGGNMSSNIAHDNEAPSQKNCLTFSFDHVAPKEESFTILSWVVERLLP